MTPELAKTFASFRPSSKTDARCGLREQGIGLRLPHAGEFLRIPSISKPITYESAEPELTEDDLGLFEVRCRQGSERDAGRRRADAPRAAMKHRFDEELTKRGAETIMLVG